MFGLLLRILGDEDRADEVAQDVYLQVWRTADRFDPERGTALTWLAMMARSRAVDRARSDGSYGEALERLETGGTPRSHGRSGEDPEETALRSERSRKVREALESLPGEQQDAVELAFFRGMTHREIADATETPLGTVKSRIRAGLSKLEEALDPKLRA